MIDDEADDDNVPEDLSPPSQLATVNRISTYRALRAPAASAVPAPHTPFRKPSIIDISDDEDLFCGAASASAALLPVRSTTPPLIGSDGLDSLVNMRVVYNGRLSSSKRRAEAAKLAHKSAVEEIVDSDDDIGRVHSDDDMFGSATTSPRALRNVLPGFESLRNRPGRAPPPPAFTRPNAAPVMPPSPSPANWAGAAAQRDAPVFARPLSPINLALLSSSSSSASSSSAARPSGAVAITARSSSIASAASLAQSGELDEPVSYGLHLCAPPSQPSGVGFGQVRLRRTEDGGYELSGELEELAADSGTLPALMTAEEVRNVEQQDSKREANMKKRAANREAKAAREPPKEKRQWQPRRGGGKYAYGGRRGKMNFYNKRR